MDSLHLREILLKVGKDIKCPLCSSALGLHNIELIDSDHKNDDCILHMQCEYCHCSFGGKAKLVEPTMPEIKKFNASSLIKSVKKLSAPISLEEKELLHHQLLSGKFSF